MINTSKLKRASLLLGLLCFAACSDETDRRDELGIEDGGDERYELVELEEGEESGATSVDSLQQIQMSAEAASEGILADAASPSAAELVVGSIGDQPIVFDPRGQFTVQIGGYRNATKARALVRQLNDAGYPTYAIARRGSDEMRVRIGYFTSRGDADRFGLIFQADHNMEYWVDKRENE